MDYKRFLIPLTAPNGAGGRCLVEKMKNGGARITLVMRGLVRRPLDLWLFDGACAYLFPKKLYPDRAGSLMLRQDAADMPLETVCCACLLDESLSPAAEGCAGKMTDWRSIMLGAGQNAAVEERTEEISPSDEANAEETAEIKEKVRELVDELGEQLTLPETKRSSLPELDWHNISREQLAQNRRLWKYARSPFVAAHCGENGLILAENERFYYLGVPCARADKLKACSQGFRIFTDRDGKGFCILKCEKQ